MKKIVIVKEFEQIIPAFSKAPSVKLNACSGSSTLFKLQ